MQVVIRRTDLSAEETPIFAFYDDNVDVDLNAHGEGMTVLTVPVSAIQKKGFGLSTLSSDWRTMNRQAIAGHEAQRRIDDVFSEEAQRSSIAELNGYIMANGTDVTKWPAAARNRKSEIDRAWSYVNAVRAKSTALSGAALPSDPTADSQWPTKIAPYRP